MVRDRFSEFQQRTNCGSNNEPDNRCFASPLDEINVSRLGYETASRSQHFLQHVNELRESIDQLQQRVHNLQQRQSAVLSQTIVGPQEKKQLEALIEEIKLHTHSLRPRVRKLENDLRRDEAQAPVEMRTGAELRIRRNQCEMLKLRLNDLLSLFNQTQFEYKSRVSKRVRRQFELVGENLSSFQVDEMLESKSQEIFYRQLTPVSFAAQMALDDATSRHNEILNLEQSIAELNEIFCDMYEIVHSQNETVDHIATNVEAANEYVRDAQIKVTHAVTYKKSAQRKKYILMIVAILVSIIVIVFLLIFIYSFLPGSSKA